MKEPVILALALFLISGLAAQDMVVIPMRCGDAFTRMAEASNNPGGEQIVVSHLASVLVRLATTEERDSAAGRLLRLHDAGPEPLLLVRDTQANIDIIRAAVERMRAEDPARPTTMRVQLTVLQVPAKVAEKHGIVADRVLTKDQEALARLLRDTVKGGGELRNLPEVVASPFVPFVAAPPAKDDDDARDVERRRPRVLGEAIGLDVDEFALDLKLVQDLPAGDAAVTPTKPALHRALRLKTGASALVSGPADAGGCMAVIWVRLFAGS